MPLAAPTVPESESIRFSHRTRSRWSDVDVQAVLNNAVYLSLCEEARFAYFDQLGLLPADGHFPFLLLQCNLRFLAPGRGPCDVVIETLTTHLGRSSLTQAYRIRPLNGDEIWAEAEAVLVFFDPKQGRSTPMSEQVRQVVAHYEGLPNSC